MQIREFADSAGVSVRTLHYYDEIGLLKPAYVDRATGYRFYDEASVLRMQEILFYRELDFSLRSIAKILSSPDYDKTTALKEQKKPSKKVYFVGDCDKVGSLKTVVKQAYELVQKLSYQDE